MEKDRFEEPGREFDYQLRNELYGVLTSIKIEPDCETLDEQFNRDLFYESKGVEIDFANVETIELDIHGNPIILQPIAESQEGILCEYMNHGCETTEPELLLICGTVFSHEFDEDGALRPNPFNYNWPASNKPSLLRAKELKGSSYIMNRRVATSGFLAVRELYSPLEWSSYSEGYPKYFNSNNFMALEINLRGKELVRAVPKLVSCFDKNITGIKASLKTGEIITHRV